MRTFVGEARFDEILVRLIERGWIARRTISATSTEEFQLTEEGQRQHQVVLAAQTQVRQQAMQGISEEDYTTAIRVLQRIVSNLDGTSEGVGLEF